MERKQKVSCPACGAEMERKLQDFSIGSDGGGGLLSLLADTYLVDLYACPQCGKVELYTAASQEDIGGEEEEPSREPPASKGGWFGLGRREQEERPPWEA